MEPLFTLGRVVQSTLSSLALLVLTACGAPKVTTMLELQSEGKTLLVQKETKTGFDTIDYAVRLVIAGIAPIVINNIAMSNELPYEDGVYGTALFEKLDTQPQRYQINGQSYGKFLTVIYIDPAVYSEADFGDLIRALKTHGAAISKAVEDNANLRKFQIAGAVRGRVDDYIERFTKNPKDYFEVRPDGDVTRVLLDAHGIKGMESRSGGGVSNVEEDRVIRLKDLKEMPLSALSQYKNAKGESLPQRFKIVIETGTKAEGGTAKAR